MYILYAVLAALGVTWLEYAYSSEYYQGFWSSLHVILIPVLFSQWALSEMFRLAPSLAIAAATFSLTVNLLRLPNMYFLGQTLSWNNVAAICCLVLAVVFANLGNLWR